MTPVYEESDEDPGTVIDQSPSGGTLVRLSIPTGPAMGAEENR